MKISFNISTSKQTYPAILNNISNDEYALLMHLKYKIKKAHMESNVADFLDISIDEF